METLYIVIVNIISIGIITAFIHHYYDKKIRTHELRLKKYFNLIEELSKLVSKEPEYEKLHRILNDALFLLLIMWLAKY